MLLASCGGQGFNIKQLAKSDIDMVSDMMLLEGRASLIQLMKKLYKRNPAELEKVTGMTVERRIAMIFEQPGRLQFIELGKTEELAAMNLAFSDSYQGDRVFALMAGLTTMLRQAYNYDDDFYLIDELDAQPIYNSARNIEVMAWKLRHKKTPQGKLYLISSRKNGVIDNTSFDRLYGKLIQTQDVMAKIIADKNNRTINTVVKSTLSVFLPI
ncbi:MAG: hypothetical protein ACJAYG_001442 [Oceanicoccus sp.]|jgi:hypothetical protein